MIQAVHKNPEIVAYTELIRERLDEKRFHHSVCVADSARVLASRISVDQAQAYTAGLLHDISKNDPPEKQLQLMREYGIMPDIIQLHEPKLLHAIAGALTVRHEVGIEDPQLLMAIRFHTTAHANMTPLDRILFVADFVSADRDYDGVRALRNTLLDGGINAAVRHALQFTMGDLCARKRAIHPDTLAAYNQFTLDFEKGAPAQM